LNQRVNPKGESAGDGAATQDRLGTKGLVIFLALLSAFVPLSTDLYLPALPTMTKYFHVPEYQTNLTLILFFVFYSLATLVWGPLSDKYGRRPVLLIGLSIYAVAGALCGLSSDIFLLMLFRVLQAIGAGAASAVATAIVKDVYQGKKRESILALVQSLIIISPAVAPVIGALLLSLTSWRGIFVAQAILGMMVIAGAVAFRETLESRHGGSIAYTLGRLVVVLGNPAFASMLLIFSMMSITTMAFISSSSYIYQETFRLSSQVYSYYFAIYAAGLMVGPLIYVRLSARFKRVPIINACFAVMVASGILVSLLGRFGPWTFAIALLPASIAISCMRPPSIYLMLDQQKGDSGSASSLMSSSLTVMGSIGMIIVSFPLGGRVQMIGALNIIFGLLCGGLWLAATRRPLLEKVRDS
jgi:MFS transporter, DHA1 family, multidrug resistance protein